MIEICSAVLDVTFQFDYKCPYPHIYQNLGRAVYGAEISRGRGNSGAEVSRAEVSRAEMSRADMVVGLKCLEILEAACVQYILNLCQITTVKFLY